MSLREAVGRAVDEDIISFSEAVSIITLQQGEIAINENLTIMGARAVTIDGNNDRIFNITNGDPASATITVSLMGLSFVNASVFVNNGNAFGGAIYSEENLVITDSLFSNNRALLTGNGTVAGGAIYVSPGALTLADARLSNNSASSLASGTTTGQGGAIYLGAGSLSLSNSLLDGNGVFGTTVDMAAAFFLVGLDHTP